MKTSSRSALVLSMLLLFGTPAALAAPEPAGAFVTKTVRFKRADIATAAGAEALYARITAAARVVCRAEPRAAVRACRSRAIEAAVRTVGSPLLSSIHGSAAERVEEVVLR